MELRRVIACVAVGVVVAGCGGTEPPASDGTEDPEATTSEDVVADGQADVMDDAHDDAMDDAHDDAMDDAMDGAQDGAQGDVDVDRVVQVDMEDVLFGVDDLTFAVGERVRFEFVNVGAAPHEALIGDLHLQEEHEADMAAGGGHGGAGHHDGVSMLLLEPGESGSFVHEFTEAGELWMGCHVPGHWAAGMRTRITVDG